MFNSGANEGWSVDDLVIAGTAAVVPTITGAATATAFTATYGAASTAQGFSVSGANLTANLIATAATGFEVANGAGAYGATATFTQSGGNASGTLNVRLKATAAVSGTYNSVNAAVLSSTGATSQNIATTSSGNTVSKATPSVTITPYSVTYDGSAHTATAGTITGVNGETDATVGSVTLSGTTHTAAGSYTTDTWSLTGTANYNNIGSTTISDTINQRVLTFTGSKTYDGNASATAAELTFGNNVDGANLTKSGSVTLASASVGSPSISSFSGLSLGGSAASSYTTAGASGTVTITKANQTITFGSLATKNADEADFNVSATSSSGLIVHFAVTAGGSVATLTDNNDGTATVHIVGTPVGSVTISASQSGDGNYNAASSVPQSFTVTSGPVDHYVVSAPGTVSRAVNFNVPVTAKDDKGNTVTTASGTQVTMARATGAGTVTFGSNPVTLDATGTFVVTAQDDTAETITISATDTGSKTGTSGNILIKDQKYLVTLPGQTFTDGSGNSGSVTAQTAGSSFTLELRVVDAGNNVDTSVNTNSVIINYTGPANSPNASAPVYTTTVDFVNGVATTTLNTTLKKAETTTITATDGTIAGVASASLTVNPAAADAGTSTVSASPGSQTTDGGATSTITVTAKDGYGNLISGQSVTLAATGTGNSLTQPGSATDSNGQTTGTIASTVAEAKTVSAVIGATAVTQTANVTFTPGVLDHFTISSISSPQTAGTAITGVTLTAKDVNNNTVTSFASTVTYGGTAGITGTSGSFTSGVLSSVSVTPTVAGSGKTLTVTASGKTGSQTFDVDPGALDHFTISSISSPQTAGTAIAGITLTALDANNNTLNTGANAFSGTVTYSGTAGVTGTSAGFTAGQLTGVSVTPTAAGTGKTLTVTASGKTGSQTFDVNPGAIDHYAVTASSPQTVGVVFNTTVTAKDALNNTVTTDGSTSVTMTSSGSAQFDSNGDSTFGDNTKTLTSGAFTISAKDDSLETITITATDGSSKTGTSGNIVINPSLKYQTKQSGNWNDFNTWQVDPGSGFVDAVSGQTPSSTDDTIVIRNGHTVTVSVSVSVDQVTVDSGGQITVSSGQTLTVANGTGTDLDVSGILNNNGTITENSGAELKAESGGQITVDVAGAATVVIPVATWSSGSTCLITNVTTQTTATGMGQSFHHFTWDSPAQNIDFTWGGALTTVNGNLTVRPSTGSANVNRVRINDSTGANPGTLTIGGNLVVERGVLNTISSSSRTENVNVAGNVTVGTGATLTSSASTCTFTFNGSSAQTVANSGTISGSFAWVVANGATVNLGTSANTGSGTFTVNATGTLGLGSATGVSGNLPSGTKTFNGTLVFNGGVAQTAGTALTVNNLTINNSTGVTLSGATTVSGALTLTSGALAIGANTLALNGTLTIGSGSLTGGSTSAVSVGGSGANLSLPAITTLGTLTVNRANGVTLSGAVGGVTALNLTSGTLNNSSFGLTLGTTATITLDTGSLSAAPTFGTTANLTYTGSTAASTGNEMPTSSTVLGTLAINNTSAGGITLGANITANGAVTVAASAKLNVPTTMDIKSTLSVNASGLVAVSSGGILKNSGSSTITSTATTLTFASGAKFQHAVASTTGTVPTAGWDANSTLEIMNASAIGGTPPSGLAQSFGNVTWDNTQSGSCNLVGVNLNSIAGTFTVKNTGSSELRLGSTQSPTESWGNLDIQAGTLVTSSSSGVPIMNVAGNVSISGGTFTVVNAAPLNVGGNWSRSGGTFTPGSGTVTFNKSSGTQAISGSTTFNKVAVSTSALALAANQTTATLTLSSVLKASGTWGATGSGAAHLNDTFFSGTAGTMNVTTGVASTTTVATSGSPSTYGGSVTFTSTTTGAANGDPVTFKDGSTTLGAGTVAGGAGQATFATSALAAGTHSSITAVYAGNDNLNTSTSSALSQTVNQRAITLSGTRAYDGTSTASAAILTAGNLVGSDVVTVASGVATLANANVGSPAISSVGTLVLGGANVANYTLTGASGSVIISALPVTLSGSRNYDGTATAAAAILSISNNLNGANLTLSGIANLASASGGLQTISAGTLALGGSAAGNYSLTGLSGSARINPAPGTMPVATTTNKPVTFKVSKLIALASDAGVTLSVTAVTSPTAHGTAVLNSGNNPITITYTPAADFAGSDAISYTLSDNVGGSSSGAVNVTVSAANVGPNITPIPGDYGSFTSSGIPDTTYIVQFSTDLSNWADQQTVTANSNNGLISYTDSVSVATHGGTVYYRLKQQ